MPEVKLPATYRRFLKAQAVLDKCDPDSLDYPFVAQAYWHAVTECIAYAPEEFGIAQPNAQRVTPCVQVPFRVLEAALEVLRGELARNGVKSFRAASRVQGGQQRHPLAAAAAKFAVKYCCASRRKLTGDRSFRKTICTTYGISQDTLKDWLEIFPEDILQDFREVETLLPADDLKQFYRIQLQFHAIAYKEHGAGDGN